MESGSSSPIAKNALFPIQSAVEETTSDKSAPDFTMVDVYKELEALKNQVSSTKSSYPFPRRSSQFQKVNTSTCSKLQDTPSRLESSINYWSCFNRDKKFLKHSHKLKSFRDEDLLEQARIVIGKRIAHHKEKSGNNGDRVHVHFKNKLIELKPALTKSQAIVLLYAFKNLPEEKIEVIERKLFPLPSKLALSTP